MQLLSNHCSAFEPLDFQELLTLWYFQDDQPAYSASHLKRLLQTLTPLGNSGWYCAMRAAITPTGTVANLEREIEIYEFWLGQLADVDEPRWKVKREVLTQLASSLEASGAFSRVGALREQVVTLTVPGSDEHWSACMELAAFYVRFGDSIKSESVWRKAAKTYNWNFPSVKPITTLLEQYGRSGWHENRKNFAWELLDHPTAEVLRMLDIYYVKHQIKELINSCDLSGAEKLLRKRVAAIKAVPESDPDCYWQMRLSEFCHSIGNSDESTEIFNRVFAAQALLGMNTTKIRQERMRVLAAGTEREMTSSRVKSECDALKRKTDQAISELKRIRDQYADVQEELSNARERFEQTRAELRDETRRIDHEKRQVEKTNDSRRKANDKSKERADRAEKKRPQRGEGHAPPPGLGPMDFESSGMTVADLYQELRKRTEAVPKSTPQRKLPISPPALKSAIECLNISVLPFVLFASTRIDLSGSVAIASVPWEKSSPRDQGVRGDIYCPGLIRLEGAVSVRGTIYGSLFGRLPWRDCTSIFPIPGAPHVMPRAEIQKPVSTLPEMALEHFPGFGDYRTNHLELTTVGAKFGSRGTKIFIEDGDDTGPVAANLLYANPGGDPWHLQIFYNGTRSILMPHNSMVSAIIYAPNAEILMPKGNHTFVGAMVGNTIEGAGVISLAYHELLRQMQFDFGIK